MKIKFKLFLAGVLPLVTVLMIIVYACNKAKDLSSVPQLKDSSVILEQADTLQNGLVLPPGSSLTIFASQPKTIHTVLPGAFRYMGMTTAGQFMSIQSLDITCTCSSGSGCNPFINSSASGCITFGGCSVCTQTIKHSFQNGAVNFTEGGIVDLSLGVRFIIRASEMTATPPVFTAMLEIPTTLAAIQTFVAPYQLHYLSQVRAKGTTAGLPAGYRMMPISVYGRSLLVPVEAAITPACSTTDIHPSRSTVTTGLSELSFSNGYSCSCGVGTGCSYHEIWIPFAGTTYYCSSGVCTSCTLHTP